MATTRSQVGVLLVVGSAIAFGITPILAIAALSETNLLTLLFLRFSIASVLLWALAIVRRQPLPSRSRSSKLVLMGAIGFVTQSFCYFGALTLINPGLVALLLYVYPAIVATLAIWRYQAQWNTRLGTAIILSIAGVGLVANAHFQLSAQGISLALGAALVNALYVLEAPQLFAQRQLTSSAIALSAAAVVFGLMLLTQPTHLQPPQTAIGWSAVVGIGCLSGFAITSLLLGAQLLTSTQAALISTLEPLVTMALTVTLLAHPLTIAQAGGSILILGAAALTSHNSPP